MDTTSISNLTLSALLASRRNATEESDVTSSESDGPMVKIRLDESLVQVTMSWLVHSIDPTNISRNHHILN